MGSTSRSPEIRWKEHNYPSSKQEVDKEIRIYGKENFELMVLEKDIPPSKVERLEKKYILEKEAMSPKGYNHFLGFFNVFLK